jgi:hypothetical protein
MVLSFMMPCPSRHVEQQSTKGQMSEGYAKEGNLNGESLREASDR